MGRVPGWVGDYWPMIFLPSPAQTASYLLALGTLGQKALAPTASATLIKTAARG